MSLFKILLFSFQGTHYRRMRWLLRLSQDVTGFSRRTLLRWLLRPSQEVMNLSRRTLLWWLLRLSQDVTGFSRSSLS